MISMRWLLLPTSFVLVTAAQPLAESRRADLRGGGGDRGKCTVEVEVEGSAEVEILGDTGILRTVSGRPAHWKRFECNAVLPTNPYEFKFRGIDGRGRQQLIRDPGSNRGGALVRIDDPKRGIEGYTFDLEWRGGSNASYRDDAFRSDGYFANTWERDVRFHGRGDGYYRNDRGANERLDDCVVEISRYGDVRVTFETGRNVPIALIGRIQRADRDRVLARVTGYGLDGDLTIELDGRDQVRRVSMVSNGLDRAELRWRG